MPSLRSEGHELHLGGAALVLLPSGGLWWAAARTYAAGDLHLGRSGRLARRGGALLPPYETEATLERLDADISALSPARVICLGDTFDDNAAEAELAEAHRLWLARLMAGREWIWIAGNHDPGPLSLGGSHLAEWRAGGLCFRHIADPGCGEAEISGHYHPRARLPGAARPAFVTDGRRLILPAFGAYTGGMAADAPEIAGLMGPAAVAVMVGAPMLRLPLRRDPDLRRGRR